MCNLFVSDVACPPCGSCSYSEGTHNTSVVLEVQEDTVSALPGLGLADNDGGVDLLAELGLALLDGGHTKSRCQLLSLSNCLVVCDFFEE